MEICSLIQLIVFAYYCQQCLAIEIGLEFVSSCNSTATFEYLIYPEQLEGLPNCSVSYGVQDTLSNSLHEDFPHTSGHITVRHLVAGLNYSLQVACADTVSETVHFVTGNEGCDKTGISGSSSASPVEVFHDQTSFLGTRDSVLGIVFGLFGFLIIVVTTFYILMKIRRRQRLERIRRYLGSSIIDPFENLQNRTDEESGSVRLIETTEN